MPRDQLLAPRRSARLRERHGLNAPHPTMATPPGHATARDASEEMESDDDDASREVRDVGQREQRPVAPKKKRTTTVTTRRVGVLRRRTTVKVAEATPELAVNNSVVDKLVDAVVRMARAEQNEVARQEERHDAQRFFREATEGYTRQMELVTTAFRETVEIMARQNEGLVNVVRERLHQTEGKTSPASR